MPVDTQDVSVQSLPEVIDVVIPEKSSVDEVTSGLVAVDVLVEAVTVETTVPEPLVIDITVPTPQTAEATVGLAVVEVLPFPGPRGPQGEPGPQGPPGGTGANAFVYVQATASALWVIDHDLLFKPHATVVVNMGNGLHEVAGEVQYVSATQVRIAFAQPVTGECYLT